MQGVIKNEVEIWKDIPYYKGIYQASSTGRIRSLTRLKKYRGKYIKVKGNLLKQNILKTGYFRVNLCKNGHVMTRKVHILIAMAFLGHDPKLPNILIHHKDHNKLNNKISNLKISSYRENTSEYYLTKQKKSKYIGVHIFRNKITSSITINKKHIYLGSFLSQKSAAMAYEIALLNIDNFNGNAKEFREIVKSYLTKEEGD